MYLLLLLVLGLVVVVVDVVRGWRLVDVACLAAFFCFERLAAAFLRWFGVCVRPGTRERAAECAADWSDLPDRPTVCHEPV